MRKDGTGPKYERKLLTISEERKSRNECVWRAFHTNIEAEPSYTDIGTRFGLTASVVRIILRQMATHENLKRLGPLRAAAVLKVLDKRANWTKKNKK